MIPCRRSGRAGWGHQEAAMWWSLGAWALWKEGAGLGVTGGRHGAEGTGGAGYGGAGRGGGSTRRGAHTALNDSCPRPWTPGAARFLPRTPRPRPGLPGSGFEALVLLWLGYSESAQGHGTQRPASGRMGRAHCWMFPHASCVFGNSGLTRPRSRHHQSSLRLSSWADPAIHVSGDTRLEGLGGFHVDRTKEQKGTDFWCTQPHG